MIEIILVATLPVSIFLTARIIRVPLSRSFALVFLAIGLGLLSSNVILSFIRGGLFGLVNSPFKTQLWAASAGVMICELVIGVFLASRILGIAFRRGMTIFSTSAALYLVASTVLSMLLSAV